MTSSVPSTRSHRRHTLAGITAVSLSVLLAGAAIAAPADDGELLKDERHRLELAKQTYDGGSKSGSSHNIEVVGHTDLSGRGFNADVAVHRGFAYVGQWGFSDWATGNNRFCPEEPDSGVAVIDATDPTSPIRVATLQNPPGTSAEDVVVFTARYGSLVGHDIAAVGIQVCGGSRDDTSFFRGLQLFDVTDPLQPYELGRLDTGCCTRGVHEIDLAHRTDLERTLVYASVPASGYPDTASPSGVRDEQGRGDFRLIDVTEPANPVEVSDWGVISDPVPGLPVAGQGCDPDGNYGHSATPSEDGTMVFVAYWDSGFIALDVTDPEHPVYQGRTVYAADADGDGHSASYDATRQLLFTADEDFCKSSPGTEPGFGYLRVFDVSNFGSPEQIGSYRTPNSTGTQDVAAGDYTIHLTQLVGDTLYASWYSDGVRVIDVADPGDPQELAYFVPPAGKNPVKPSQRSVLTNTTQVWGVAVDEATGLIYLSDMNTGLWIVRRTDAAAGT